VNVKALTILLLSLVSPIGAQTSSPPVSSSAPQPTQSASVAKLQSASPEGSSQKAKAPSPILDTVKRILDGLNELQGLLITVFTAVLVLYNRSLARETAQLRKRETEPKLEVYLLPYEGGNILINMVVRNVGGGAARDIKWNIDADEADLEAHGVNIHKMALFKVLHYLPSEERIVFFFGSAVEILKEPSLKPVTINVSYNNDARDNPQNDEFTIDLQPLVGMSTIGTPPPYEIAQALKEISKDFHHLVTEFHKPVVRTIDEVAFQEAERKRVEEIGAEMEKRKPPAGGEGAR
jgi:hypothetical protein